MSNSVVTSPQGVRLYTDGGKHTGALYRAQLANCVPEEFVSG